MKWLSGLVKTSNILGIWSCVALALSYVGMRSIAAHKGEIVITLRVSTKGRLINMLGGDRNDMNYSYDDEGRLVTVVVDGREKIDIAYDSDGNIEGKQPMVEYIIG